MEPYQDLYDFFKSKNFIDDTVTFDQFTSRFSDETSVLNIHKFLQGKQAVSMDAESFSKLYLKKKATPNAMPTSGLSEPAVLPGNATSQPGETQGGFPSIQFEPANVTSESTNAVSGETTRFDPTQYHNITGNENPVEWTEKIKLSREGEGAYQRRKTTDESSLIKSSGRRVDDAIQYANTANSQYRYNKAKMDIQFGPGWENELSTLNATLQDDNALPEYKQKASERMNAIVSSEFYQKMAGAQKGAANAEQLYYLETNNGALREFKRRAAERQAEVDKQYGDSFWAPKADFVLRKGMDFLGSALTLPRTFGEAIPGDSGKTTPNVADILGSWGDDIMAVSSMEFPKPVALQASAFEDVVDFNGEKVVVDDKGAPTFIIDKDGKRRKADMAFREVFATSDKPKPKVEFSGAGPILDKTATAAADLLIMRYVGGGSKLGTAAASVAITHNGLYNEAVAAGLGPEEAAQYAATGSVVNAAIEAYIGNIETAPFKKAALTESKAITKEAVDLIKGGMNPSQAAWESMKGRAKNVIKETVGENSEEFIQSLYGDYNRAVFETSSNPMKAETDGKSIAETMIVTTLLTAPLAAFGVSGYTTASRQSALMAAINNPDAFGAAVNSMVEAGHMTQDEANTQVAKIEKLRKYRDSLPDGLTFERQADVLSKQEFIEDNSKDETVMPEQQAAKKETVKAVSEDITASLAPTPPAPATETVATVEPVTPTTTISTITAQAPTDIDERASYEQDVTASITGTVRDILAERGVDVPETKVSTAVANTVFQAPEVQGIDTNEDIESIAERIATQLMPEDATEYNTPEEAMRGFARNGGRVSLIEKRQFPQASDAWFDNDAPTVSELATDIAAKTGSSIQEAKAAVIRHIKTSPRKQSNIIPAAVEQSAAQVGVEITPEDVAAINNNQINEQPEELDAAVAQYFGTPEAAADAIMSGETQNTPLDGKEPIFKESEPAPISETQEGSQGQGGGEVQIQGEGQGNANDTGGQNENAPAGESLRVSSTATSVDATAGSVAQREPISAAIVRRSGVILPVNAPATPQTPIDEQINETAASQAAIADATDSDFVTRETDTEFIVLNADGIQDSLLESGGTFVQGKGWVFPIENKQSALAAIDRTKADRPSLIQATNGGSSGSLAATIKDKAVAAAAAMRKRRINSASSINDALDVISEHVGPVGDKVAKAVDAMRKAFPGVSIVTDPDIIDAIQFNGPRPAAFVKDGKVYIDMRRAGSDTPIHEFGHIWQAAMKGTPLHVQGIASVIGSEYEKAVRADSRYEMLTDDEVWEEALSQAIGERGARLVNMTSWQKFAQFFGDMIDFFKVKLGFNPFTMSADDFATLIARDIMKGGDYTSPEIARMMGDVTKFQYTPQDAQNDLDVANKMYSEGKSQRAINVATGFIVGADGRWEWRPVEAEIAPDVRAALDGDVLDLPNVVFSETIFNVDPALKEAKVLFTSAVSEPTAGLTDEGIIIMMPIGKDNDAVSSSLRELIKDLIKIRIGLGIDLKISQTTDNAKPTDIRAATESLTNAYREIAEALRIETGQHEAKKNFRLNEETLIPDFGTAQALGLPTPPASISPGFDDIDSDHGKYDASKDALRKAAVREGARVLIERAIRTGEATADDLAQKFHDRFGIDYDWTYAEYDSIKQRQPGGSRHIDFLKAKKAEAKKKVVDSVKKWFTRQFSYKGLLPKDIFDLNRRHQGEVNAIMSTMERLTNRLEAAMEKEFGKDMTLPANKQYPSGRELVDAILKKEAPIESVSPELGAVITQMRSAVDRLSVRLLQSGGLGKSVVIRIMEGVGIEMKSPAGDLIDNSNYIAGILSKPPFMRTEQEQDDANAFLKSHSDKFGTYLNRSYRAHTFPDWVDRIPEDVMNNAKAFIQADLLRQADEIAQGLAEYESAITEKKAAAKEKIDAILKKIDAKIAAATPTEAVKLSAVQQEMMDLLAATGVDLQDKLDDTTVKGVARDIISIKATLREQLKQERRITETRTKAVEKLNDLHGRIKNIDGEINRVLDYKTALYPVSNKGVVGAKDRSVLKNRKDIPEEIRALLGEFKDPTINFATTITKMATLTANQEFLNAMRKRYEGVFFFESPGTNNQNWKQFGSEGNQNLSPLSGWYTTPDVYEAMMDFYEPAKMDGWQRFLIGNIIAPVKIGKTVLSPETHPRNFFGNAMFHAIHGWSPSRASGAITDWKNRKTSDAWAARAEKYYKYGIFGESVTKQDLEVLMNDIENRYTIGLGAAGGVVDGIANAGMWVYDKAKKAYEAEDEIHRVVAFENEVAKYAKAWYGIPVEQLSPEQLSSVESRAADIVSHIMPTASFVPRILKTIRRFPFTGTFVTFPAEMLRVAYNTVDLARSEMQDPRTRGLGVRRAAGLSFAIAGLQVMGTIIKSLFGYDDEYWESLNRFLPSFSKNAQIIPVATSEKGYPKYWNVGYTNPFSFMNKAWNALNGSENYAKGLVDATGSVLDPFLSPELTFATLQNLVRGKNDKDKDIKVESLKDPILNSTYLHPENLKRQLNYVVQKLRPGFAKSAQDAYEIAFDESDHTGRVKTWSQYTMAHLLGVKIETFDPSVAAGIKAYNLRKMKDSARDIYTAKQNELNRAWKNMHSGETPPTQKREENFHNEAVDELIERYEVATEAYIAAIKEASQMYKDGLNVGLTDEQLSDIFKDAGFSTEKGELSAIKSGNVSNLRLLFKKKDKY